MPEIEKERICFVITPIDEEGSEIRIRSDQILNHIIIPVATECGYKPVIRADQISKPAGMITPDVIQHLINDEFVIADLTGHNPNVFYELAIRHTIRKPVIHIIQKGETIPFDLAQSRAIQLDHRNLDSVANCKEEMTRQIRHIEENPSDVDSPVAISIDLQMLRKSENLLEKSNARIIEMLQKIQEMLGSLVNLVNENRLLISPMTFERTDMERLRNLWKVEESSQLPKLIVEQPTPHDLRASLETLAKVFQNVEHVLSPFSTSVPEAKKTSTEKAEKEE